MAAREDAVSDIALGSDWVLWERIPMGGGVRQSGVCRLFQHVGAGRRGAESFVGMPCADNVGGNMTLS
mgnify:CR=1 FL=1